MEILKPPKGHYTYIHYLGLDPVYVGKGSGGRVFSEREYEHDGARIIADGMSSSEARELERLVIETYGYENLHNVPHKVGRKGGRKKGSLTLKEKQMLGERIKNSSPRNPKGINQYTNKDEY